MLLNVIKLICNLSIFYTFLLYFGFNLFSFIARYEVVFFTLNVMTSFLILFCFQLYFCRFFISKLSKLIFCLSQYISTLVRMPILGPINTIKVFHKTLGQSFLWSCKTASKTLSKNSDGLWRNRNPSYFSKNFDRLMEFYLSNKIYVNKSTWVWKMVTRRSRFVWSNETNFDRVKGITDKVFFEQTKNFDQVFDKNFDHVNRILSRIFYTDCQSFW